MFFLKEEIRTITCPRDRETAFELLLEKLQDMRLPVEEADRSEGVVLARCFSVLVNIGFWRCYGDKLLFEIKEVGRNVRSICVYGIPNLLRINAKREEVTFDVKALLSELNNCWH